MANPAEPPRSAGFEVWVVGAVIDRLRAIADRPTPYPIGSIKATILS